MKNPHRPNPSAILSRFAALLTITASAAGAVIPTEWQHRQELEVARPGLIKVSVPPATFDHAAPGLTDLRVVDAEGREVPYLLDSDLVRDLGRPAFATPPPVAAKSFRPSRTHGSTQLLIETGTAGALDAIELETTSPYFLKAVHVETSADGLTWESLGPALPVFRQFGAEQLRLPLQGRKAAFVRITIDDFRSRAVTFDHARVLPAPTRPSPPPLASVGAKIVRRDEYAGESLLTIALEGRHVPLAMLALECSDPLFMRRITVAVREVRTGVAGERVIATGTIYRVALDGAPVRTQLELPVDFIPTTTELLVHVHNGDSPPLAITGVHAGMRPVSLLLMAREAGRHHLLLGNAQANPPRYDLATFAGELRQADAIASTPGAVQPMPAYQPRVSLTEPPLPDVPLSGAALDWSGWSGRREIRIATAGVQELELDPTALARARPDFADLRLLRQGNQIPYLLELPALARTLTLIATESPDPKRPSVSAWRVQLPDVGLPLRRILLGTDTPLFQRQFRLYEKRSHPNGGTAEHTLAAGAWSRTPEPGVAETRTFELSERVLTDTIWIETDNGDNPPLALTSVQATYPVVRLVFKVADISPLELLYGNKQTGSPRYDLSLVAPKLLMAARNPTTLADASPTSRSAAERLFTGMNRGVLFWGVLILVVVVLLLVVAKLLPKPPAA